MTSKLAAGVLYLIAIGQAGFDLSAGFACSGFGEHSPGKCGFGAALVTVLVMTFMFLIVILCSTHKRASPGFAGLAIGLALTLIHLISISVTNTSMNPARSTGPALFVGGWPIEQLWLFWLAPIGGAVVAGDVWRAFLEREPLPGGHPEIQAPTQAGWWPVGGGAPCTDGPLPLPDRLMPAADPRRMMDSGNG